MFKDGIGIFLWKLSVGLYLIANGVLGMIGDKKADFNIIFSKIFGSGDAVSIIIKIISVFALIAGIMVLIEMFGITIRILDTIALCLAIIWAVYIIIGIISWLMAMKDMNFWYFLQRLGVHTMVLGSLLITAKKGR